MCQIWLIQWFAANYINKIVSSSPLALTSIYSYFRKIV
ncbi:hypothetical protein RintRC_0277 [Richelia intracellularis]|nr:hypothetical protein RintRC_0277 [Richelia intracellularis]